MLARGVARGAPAVEISGAPLEDGCRLAAVVEVWTTVVLICEAAEEGPWPGEVTTSEAETPGAPPELGTTGTTGASVGEAAGGPETGGAGAGPVECGTPGSPLSGAVAVDSTDEAGGAGGATEAGGVGAGLTG